LGSFGFSRRRLRGKARRSAIKPIPFANILAQAAASCHPRPAQEMPETRRSFSSSSPGAKANSFAVDRKFRYRHSVPHRSGSRFRPIYRVAGTCIGSRFSLWRLTRLRIWDCESNPAAARRHQRASMLEWPECGARSHNQDAVGLKAVHFHAWTCLSLHPTCCPRELAQDSERQRAGCSLDDRGRPFRSLTRGVGRCLLMLTSCSRTRLCRR
jgi:hypothetical protein